MKLPSSLLASLLVLADPGQALAPSGEPPEWVHVVPFGVWRGHSYGPFQVTELEALQLIRNFEARAPNARVVIDYHHQTLSAEYTGVHAIAAGWIDRLELRADGVWGHIELWTETAAAHLRAREYRFLSPVLQFDHVAKVSGIPEGTYLHSVALTNTPFLDELTAVVNSDTQEPPVNLRALLGLAETATDDEVVAAIQALNAVKAAALATLGLGLDTPPAACAEALSQAAGPVRLGRVALAELAYPTVGDEQESAFRLVLSHSGYVPVTEHVAALQSGERQVLALTDEQLLEQGKREGKITPVLEPWFKGQLARDRHGAMAWLQAATPVVPLVSPLSNPLPTGATGGLSAEEAAVTRQLGLTPKQFIAQKEG